jgi:ABC-type multidrug transport system permease subunit
MPPWIQDISSVNPISVAVNAVRVLSLPNQFAAGTVIEAIAVIGAIAVVTLGATLYLFRKVVS